MQNQYPLITMIGINRFRLVGFFSVLLGKNCRLLLSRKGGESFNPFFNGNLVGMVLFNISRKITFPDMISMDSGIHREGLASAMSDKLFRPKGLNDDDDDEADWETGFGLFRWWTFTTIWFKWLKTMASARWCFSRHQFFFDLLRHVFEYFAHKINTTFARASRKTCH